MSSQSFSMANLSVDGKKLALDAQVRINETNTRNAALRENLPVFPVPVYCDADEASNAYRDFMLQPDAGQRLDNAHELLFDLHTKESNMLDVLGNATEEERRIMLGWDEKNKPSLPGIPDTHHHVDGTLEVVRHQIAALEAEIPVLKIHAARYDAIRKSFAVWPVHRINEERNARVRRADIVRGRLVS